MSIINTGFNVVAMRSIAKPYLVEPIPVEPTRSARFVYDREVQRSFVELRDDESGRVISRFPAEQPGAGIVAENIQKAVANAKLLDVLA